MAAAGFSISDDLRRSVELRLLYGLSRFGPSVERVVVRLADVANPMGGVDRRCHMEAWLRGEENVCVETMDGTLAVDRAVGRLVERVEWALGNGQGETDVRLTPEALRAKAEGVPYESLPASRAIAGRETAGPKRKRKR